MHNKTSRSNPRGYSIRVVLVPITLVHISPSPRAESFGVGCVCCLLVAVTMAVALGEGLRRSNTSINFVSLTCRTSVDAAIDAIPSLSEYANSAGNATDAAKDYYCKHKIGDALIASLEAVGDVYCNGWINRGWLGDHIDPIKKEIEGAGCGLTTEAAVGIAAGVFVVLGCVVFVVMRRKRN
jgi:hypothetical protein